MCAQSVTAKAPTKAQSRAADKANAGLFDNWLNAVDVTAVFTDAVANDMQSEKLRGTATYETAYACLIIYERLYGKDNALKYKMGDLSTEKATAFFDKKRKQEFVNDVAKACHLINPGTREFDNNELKSAAIREWNTKRNLIGRGLNFACDLIESGANLQHSLLAGECASWWNTDAKAFEVPYTSLLRKGFRPYGDLYGMVHGDQGATPPIPARPDLKLALDGTYYYERSDTPPIETKEFQCTAERIRIVAATKRQKQRADNEMHRIPAKGAEQTTIGNAGKAGPLANAPTPGIPEPSTMGRPAGSSSEVKQTGLDVYDFKDVLMYVFKQLNTTVPRTGKAEDYYWSTDPCRDLIASIERCCRMYRESAIEFERNHKQSKLATKADKISMMPAISIPTKSDKPFKIGDNDKSATPATGSAPASSNDKSTNDELKDKPATA